jgi:hypothetical protein
MSTGRFSDDSAAAMGLNRATYPTGLGVYMELRLDRRQPAKSRRRQF